MKVVHKNIEGGAGGSIGLIPEENEDMWHVYNLVAIGDKLRAPTFRKV